MSKRITRWIWIPVVLLVLVAGGYFGSRLLERTVLKRSERILTGIGGPGSTIRVGQVDIDLWAGDLRWSDLLIESPPGEPDSTEATRMNGRVDGISVHGLSLWRLLVARTLSMRSITISRPDIQVIMSSDTTANAPDRAKALTISSLQAESVVLEGAVFRMRWTGADSTTISAERLDLDVTDVRCEWPQDRPFALRYANAHGKLAGIAAALPPLYDFRVASVALAEEGRTLHILNAEVEPRKGQQSYDRVTHFEVDLFDASMDTATMTGLDLMGLFNENTLSATTLRIAGVELDVSRDRTMPDAPYKYKPLLSRLLRELPIALCLDSVVVDRWNVGYHEKGALTPDFGDLVFNDLGGTITGLCTSEAVSRDTLEVKATARLYDRTRMSMQVRMVIADSSDRFTAHALIGGLPISGFNRLTADLMRVRARGGTIGGIEVTMTANDDRATGRVDMEYDGLQLELLKQDGSGEKRRFMSGLVNTVVRSHNLRSDPDFRHGDFTIDRRKDRFVFNYLWAGLREGMIISVLPGAVESVRQMDKGAKKK